MKASEPPIVASEVFNVSADVLWSAITEVDEMHQWYFNNIPAFEATVGFKTEFLVDAGERSFLHMWEVVAVEPSKMIRYTWRYPNYEGDAHVTFEIDADESGQTRLTVTCTILKDFQAGIPEFTRESCQGGWNYFIKDSLKKYIDSLS